VSEVAESPDLDSHGMDITFDGVDQTIISILMSNHTRGQRMWCWKAWYNVTTAALEGSAVRIFDGYQNERYTIGETSTDNPDAVQVTTRVVSRVTRVGDERTTVTNVVSHNEMLERSGDSPANQDTFWVFVPSLVNKDVHWGKIVTTPGAPYYPPGGPNAPGVIPGPGGPTPGYDGPHH